MPNTMTVRIPVVVTSDGRWASSGSHGEDPDWNWLHELMDDEDPTASTQMFVVAEITLPDTIEVKATAVELDY